MEIKDRQTSRILIVEKLIMMPAKAALIVLTFLFYWTPDQDFHFISKKFLFYQTMLYICANGIFYVILTWAQIRRWALGAVKASAFLLSIIDNLYISFLIPITGGMESPLYWAYSGLMVRNALDFPKIKEQGLINLALCIFYGGAIYYSEKDSELFMQEVFYLRVMVLFLVSICCWGIYALIQRKNLQLEERREIQIRREKIHAIRRLAGEIAHGLKNPLTIINNSAYYLGKQLKDGSQEVQKHVGIIREEIERSDKILNQIMDYAKLSTVKIEKLDINKILNHIIDEMRLNTTYPNVKIQKSYDRQLPTVFFDEGQLRQIFSNLLINAIEAIQAKESHAGLIIIKTALLEDGQIKVVFQDNGNGIREGERKKIFDPFFTTKEKGTGLGLSIVKNLVETYDGSVEVFSKHGEGSIFIVKLPLKADIG